MTNFSRALHIALRYKMTLVGLLLSSIMVAVLWGANLGTIYPIVGVVLKQRSLHEWVDESITQSTERADAAETKIADFERQLAELKNGSGDERKLKRALRRQRTELSIEQKALANSQKIKPWIVKYLPRDPFPTLGIVVGLLMVGTLLKVVFLVTSVVLVERLAQLTAFDLRKALYRRTLGMNLSQFGQDRTSELLSHFTHDMEGITAGVRTFFGRAIREPLKIIACLVGAAIISWRLLVFCLIVTPVAIYLINRLSKSVKRANRRAMDQMAGVYSHLSESFDGIQIVKAFTMERHERRRMHVRAKEYLHKALRIAVYRAFSKPCVELMSISVVGLAILAGGYLVLNEQTHLLGIRMDYRPLTFERLMTFFALLAGVSDPFRKLSEVYNQLQRGDAAADRVYALMDREAPIRDAEHALPKLPVLETLSLEKLHFEYQDDHPVLRDVSINIRAGERIAIVGPNGCGKSSLLSLLPRFYDPQQGRILWNNHDLRDVRIGDLRSRIGIVTQQTQLFDETVLDNIRYGSTNASDEQVEAAARKAHAHGFIMNKLSEGYGTIVGQRGKLLSGGQRQRIALARAILRDPEILILDEATSQVDLESEQLIHQALQDFMVGRTTLMITHRMSSLALADRIIVMQAGAIIDIGTHDELTRRCDTYARLHEVQFRASA